ncbi:hypothetical protein PXD56_01125 [Maribacter sp. SA7]|uniref:hypothetical protein n=1 Tax=Maribacter zhoushanensis TaxID=3030012 RepID=UPI0023EA9F80|nr:hypothetical protein [Maribacter zhoushanensis]MDF4201535.1 hypothetical protein [Maribacter zhoushanensis]
MQNTITLNSDATQNQLGNASKLKSSGFTLNESLKSILIYTVFLATCLTMAYSGFVTSAIALFLLGTICLAAFFIWNNASKIEMDLSFKVDLKQSELEKDLYREIA